MVGHGLGSIYNMAKDACRSNLSLHFRQLMLNPTESSWKFETTPAHGGEITLCTYLVTFPEWFKL